MFCSDLAQANDTRNLFQLKLKVPIPVAVAGSVRFLITAACTFEPVDKNERKSIISFPWPRVT